MVSKVVRADAGHLARCVRDDHHRLKSSQNRAVDIWASDCLNMESLGLLSAGINPFTLPHQTGQIVFHRARIRIIQACQVALFKSVSKDQIWILGSSSLDKALEEGRQHATGVQRCVPLVELRYRPGRSSSSSVKKHRRG